MKASRADVCFISIAVTRNCCLSQLESHTTIVETITSHHHHHHSWLPHIIILPQYHSLILCALTSATRKQIEVNEQTWRTTTTVTSIQLHCDANITRSRVDFLHLRGLPVSWYCCCQPTARPPLTTEEPWPSGGASPIAHLILIIQCNLTWQAMGPYPLCICVTPNGKCTAVDAYVQKVRKLLNGWIVRSCFVTSQMSKIVALLWFGTVQQRLEGHFRLVSGRGCRRVVVAGTTQIISNSMIHQLIARQ